MPDKLYVSIENLAVKSAMLTGLTVQLSYEFRLTFILVKPCFFSKAKFLAFNSKC